MSELVVNYCPHDTLFLGRKSTTIPCYWSFFGVSWNYLNQMHFWNFSSVLLFLYYSSLVALGYASHYSKEIKIIFSACFKGNVWISGEFINLLLLGNIW